MFLKLIVLSDSHGDLTNLHWLSEQILREIGPVDAIVHCGDGYRDFESMQAWFLNAHPGCRFYAVAGNCDFHRPASDKIITEMENIKVMITHGHMYQVKSSLSMLDIEAKKQDCRLVLYGHTHRPSWEMRGTLLINPGAAKDGRAAYVEINGDQINGRLLEF